MASISPEDNEKLEELKKTQTREEAREAARQRAAARDAAPKMSPEEEAAAKAEADAARKERKTTSRKKSHESLKAGERTATPRASTVKRRAEIADLRLRPPAKPSNRSEASDQVGKPFAKTSEMRTGKRRIMFRKHYDVLTPDLQDYKRINTPEVETPVPPELVGRGTTSEGTPREETYEGQVQRSLFLFGENVHKSPQREARAGRLAKAMGLPNPITEKARLADKQRVLSEHLRDQAPATTGYAGAAISQMRGVLPAVSPDSPKGEVPTAAYELATDINKKIGKMQTEVPSTGVIQRTKRPADTTLPRPTRQRFRRKPGFKEGEWVEESLFPEHMDKETGQSTRIVRTLKEVNPGPRSRTGKRNMAWRSVDPSGGTPLQPPPVPSTEAPAGTRTEEYVAAVNGVPTEYARRLELGKRSLEQRNPDDFEDQTARLSSSDDMKEILRIIKTEAAPAIASHAAATAEPKPTGVEEDISNPVFDDPTSFREAVVEPREPVTPYNPKPRSSKKRVTRSTELATDLTAKQKEKGTEELTMGTRTTNVFPSDIARSERLAAQRAAEDTKHEEMMKQTMSPQKWQSRRLRQSATMFEGMSGYGGAARNILIGHPSVPTGAKKTGGASSPNRTPRDGGGLAGGLERRAEQVQANREADLVISRDRRNMKELGLTKNFEYQRWTNPSLPSESRQAATTGSLLRRHIQQQSPSLSGYGAAVAAPMLAGVDKGIAQSLLRGLPKRTSSFNAGHLEAKVKYEPGYTFEGEE